MLRKKIFYLATIAFGTTLVLALYLPACVKSPVVPEKPSNVLLITIDTTRADHLPLYGYEIGRTPNLDALASDGVLFREAVSHAPLTLPSHTSILTGTYPLFHGVRNNGDYFASDSLNSLAEMMKSAGYDTAAFVGSFVLDSRFGLDQGFDVYKDDMIDGRQKHTMFEFKDILAERVVNRVISWLDGRKADSGKPFFIWMHLYDPHREYEPPPPFDDRFAAHPYDGEIAYADSQIGRLFDRLKEAGQYEKTMITVTSDHGESMGEHGELTHSVFIYNATTHIPLIMKPPGGKFAGKTVKSMVRHIDIVPTVLDVTGAIKKADKNLLADLQGVSLKPLMEGKEDDLRLVSYAEAYLVKDYYNWDPPVFLRTGDSKFIDLPTPEFYDLRADPDELHNIYAEKKEDAQRFAGKLKELRKTMSVGRVADARREMDKETLSKLKALGYLHGDSDYQQTDDNKLTGKDPKDLIVVHEQIQKVHHLIEDKQHAEAVELALKLLKTDPKNIKLIQSVASSYVQLNEIEKAIAEFNKIKKLNPKILAPYLGLCGIYTKKTKDFKAAEKELKAAFSIQPDAPSLLVVKGNLEQEQGRVAEAVEAYMKSIEMGEQSAPLFVGLGSAFNKLGQTDKAEKYLEKAIFIENDYSEAHYNLGVIYERTGKTAEAEKKYRLAIQYDDKNHYAHTNLGSLLTRQEKYTEAEAELKKALEIEPDHLEALYNLGTVYLKIQKPGKAVKWLEKAVKISPSLFFARNNLALAYIQSGDKAKGFETYRRGTELFPENPILWYRMAGLKADGKEKAEAKKYLDKAIELGGERIRKTAESDPRFKDING